MIVPTGTISTRARRRGLLPWRTSNRAIFTCSTVLAVSGGAARAHRDRYGRGAAVVHSGIDARILHPPQEESRQRAGGRPYLIVGSDALEFKRTQDMIRAYQLVREAGYQLDLVWVTPHPPAIRREHLRQR